MTTRATKKNEKKVTVEMAMAPAEYLKKPYGRVVVPEPDGTFRAEIIEFPGCIATGDTAAEALACLEDIAVSWLEATIAKGLRVPEPIENAGFSGKLVVRLPKSLHKKAAHAASREGVSLNQFIVSCVSEQVGARAHQAYLQLVQIAQPTSYVHIGRLTLMQHLHVIAKRSDTPLIGIPFALLPEKQHARD
jgi:predicted RNase H-like HicB family nuclease